MAVSFPADVRLLGVSPPAEPDPDRTRPSQLPPATIPILPTPLPPPPACAAAAAGSCLGGLSANELFLRDSVVPGGRPSMPLRVTSVLLPLGVACGGVWLAEYV